MNYGKLIEGKIQYFTPVKGGIEADGKIIITNNESVYNQYGWYRIENINEVGVDSIEDNVLKHYIGVERTIEMAKAEKIAEIDSYDTSDAVNSFTFDGQTMWIDKATRVGLVNAIECTMTMGEENITFGIQNVSVTLPCATAIKMMAALEVYALQCYNVTLAHKNAVNALTFVDDVDAYDYTTGYPDKLEF